MARKTKEEKRIDAVFHVGCDRIMIPIMKLGSIHAHIQAALASGMTDAEAAADARTFALSVGGEASGL